MTTLKTVEDPDFKLKNEDHSYNYQSKLTEKLDELDNTDFNQEIINEIVLWKVDRYASVDDDTLEQINKIKPETTKLDEEMTRDILMNLLQTKGIQLAMASTILRFRNRNIYQIIDQRVYRIIYKDKLKLKTQPNDKNLNDQIDLYIKYLKDLTDVCEKFNIPFDKSDRILFMADKRINKDISLDNYTSKTKERN